MRDLEQWFFKITDYADRLLDDMEELDWPDAVLDQQRHWIGRSEGARVTFKIAETGDEIPIFTTRPDTLYGVTFFVFAAEHPVARALAERAGKGAEYAAFVDDVRRTTEIDRMATQRERKRVRPAGARDQPAERRRGAGVRVRLRADGVRHRRDHGRARTRLSATSSSRSSSGLPVRRVVESDGRTCRSRAPASWSTPARSPGCRVDEGKAAVIAHLEEQGIGRGEVNYRMRDWLISRQRYWGTPFPVVYCETDGIVPLSDADLPVRIPEDIEYVPTDRRGPDAGKRRPTG